MFPSRASSRVVLGLGSTARMILSASEPRTATKTTGTRCAAPSGRTDARRATVASANRRRASPGARRIGLQPQLGQHPVPVGRDELGLVAPDVVHVNLVEASVDEALRWAACSSGSALMSTR